jgi:hypothetical protein
LNFRRFPTLPNTKNLRYQELSQCALATWIT